VLQCMRQVVYSLELVVSFLSVVSDPLLNVKNWCCDRPKV
jgi:hypothetical protein